MERMISSDGEYHTREENASFARRAGDGQYVWSVGNTWGRVRFEKHTCTLTVLGDPNVGDERTNAELSIARLSVEQRTVALSRLQTAFTVLFTVFGVPSVFYGDEAGLEGHRDPFCRRPYPWNREDASLVEHVRLLGQLRRENACFRDGDFRILSHSEHTVAYERRSADSAVIVAVNAGQDTWHFVPDGRHEALVAGGCDVHGTDVAIPAGGAVVLREVRA